MNSYQLSIAGVNVAGGVSRFGGVSSIYEKYLKKFPADENYSKLKISIGENDAESAFQYAHALKGLAGNLSLQKLYDALSPFVEELRCGDLSHCDEFLARIDPIYNAVVSAISE